MEDAIDLVLRFLGLKPTMPPYWSRLSSTPYWSTPMLTVDITLDARPYDQYASSRIANGLKGHLHNAITHICEVLSVDSIDIDHNAQLVYIKAHTGNSAAEAISSLYNHTEIASRLKRVKTNLDLSPISAPQRHVPTEYEIIKQARERDPRLNTLECPGGTGCDPDYCMLHDV